MVNQTQFSNFTITNRLNIWHLSNYQFFLLLHNTESRDKLAEIF